MVNHTDTFDSGRLPSTCEEVTEWKPVAHQSFEQDSDGDLTSVIIGAVAAAEGVAATTITSPPLFEVVDATAIKALFFEQPSLGQRRHSPEKVEFRYRGFRVTVTSDGQVVVAEPVRGETCG